MNASKILVVDDNPEIRNIVNILLSGEGYEITEAANGEEALARLSETAFDLIILDVMMPGMDGYQTCLGIRKISNAPILFLSARTQDGDKTLGFQSGGDDYLAKPFSYNELLSRVKALLRRYQVYQGKEAGGTAPGQENHGPGGSFPGQADYGPGGSFPGQADHGPGGSFPGQGNHGPGDSFPGQANYGPGPGQPVLQKGQLQVWERDQRVLLDGREIELTDTEYQILLLLMKHDKQIFSASHLYESIWQEPYYYGANNTIMVHIRNLRKKIEKDPQNPKIIRTIWGKGYRFDA